MGGANRGVALADGEGLPIGPRDGDHPVRALDIEARDLMVEHGAEDFGRAGGGECVPVSVEDEDGGFVKRHENGDW